MNKKGLTIIELLLVITLIAVIAVIAMPSIFNVVDDTDAKEKEAYEKLVKNKLEMYNIDNEKSLWIDEQNVICYCDGICSEELSMCNNTNTLSIPYEVTDNIGDYDYIIDYMTITKSENGSYSYFVSAVKGQALE